MNRLWCRMRGHRKNVRYLVLNADTGQRVEMAWMCTRCGHCPFDLSELDQWQIWREEVME